MPPRYSRRRPTRPPANRESRRVDNGISFGLRPAPQPDSSIILVPLPDSGDPPTEWELSCRDGWEWRPSGPPGHVAVRATRLTAAQAVVVHEWLERIKDPAVWWAVSRELQAVDSDPEVAQALRQDPWLAAVFPVVLEASTEGSPPPPPSARS